MGNSALLTIGSEVIDGRVLNTNSQYLGRIFQDNGLPVNYALSCDDKEQDIIDSLEFALKRSRLVLITGGLGPTSDDITRQVVAKFFGVDLVEDPRALQHLLDWYGARGRSCDGLVLQQALLPAGGVIIDNPVGSAAGFVFEDGERMVCALPGVPRELTAMMETGVLPYLRERQILAPAMTRAFWRIFGVPESDAQRRLGGLALPSGVSLSYRAAFPEVHVQLSSREQISSDLTDEVTSRIGAEWVVSNVPAEGLPQVVYRLLLARQAKVVVAESCTGGGLGSLISEVPGASAVFDGGVVTYCNLWKEGVLKVKPSILEEHGAVSRESALAMAQGVREFAENQLVKAQSAQFSSSESTFSSEIWGLSITGVAGPDGGTPVKPVGTFFVGLTDGKDEYTFRMFFPSSRDKVRIFAAYSALDALRRALLGLPRAPETS